jgi:TetR/AcrR family transcriptional repressor of mexJK operon
VSAVETTGRSARKHADILDAARTVFLRSGYGGASMDEIAAVAGVSKQTIYKHFADKDRLFAEIVTADIDAADRETRALVDALADTQDIAGDLTAFARRHIVDVTRPHLVRMRRMIIAEAERFPAIARRWFERGPEKAHATLAAVFAGLAERGVLRVGDPLLAARHFNWLVLSIPLNEAMFLGAPTATRAQLRRYADEAVRVFLAAYGA